MQTSVQCRSSYQFLSAVALGIASVNHVYLLADDSPGIRPICCDQGDGGGGDPRRRPPGAVPGARHRAHLAARRLPLRRRLPRLPRRRRLRLRLGPLRPGGSPPRHRPASA
uniref:Uncharacterized protein n=1 Tax=Zea mays TaxID=4577 RepID=C0PPI5_MAIZE|nr:unknown [Zea mays]